MSERYATCSYCRGSGYLFIRKNEYEVEKKPCSFCDETGFDGSVAAYEEAEQRQNESGAV